MADVEASEPQLFELKYLAPADLQFERSPGGVLRLHLADRCVRRVSIYRLFPLTQAETWLSVRADEEEIGVLRDLEGLAPEQLQLVREAVERRYFRPQITGVSQVEDHAGQYTWQVETDRGAISFTTQHPRQSTTRLEDGRWLVTDVDNNRYEIPDFRRLDRHSRSVLLLLLG